MSSSYNAIKRRVYALLSVADTGDRANRSVDVFLAALILLNVLAAILQTMETLYDSWPRLFDGFELISVAVFTLEYVLRVWSCTSNPSFAAPLTGRLRFVLTIFPMIDLLAIAPFYFSAFVALDLRMLRAVRLIRLARIFKIARYSDSLQLLGRVIVAKRSELLITLTAAAVLLVIASSLMYYAERDVQPDAFSSIPAAMWWGVTTLTTVGYGDVYPITTLGRFIAALDALLGIGLFALPAGILGSGFVDELQIRKRAPTRCPRCGWGQGDDPSKSAGN